MNAQASLLTPDWPDPPRAPERVEFVVYGLPAPQGSKRHVGNGVMIESSKKVAPWREDVGRAAREVKDGRPAMDGPIRARMVFTLPKPKSAPKTRRTWPDRKPDVSKLARSTEDALVTAGLIQDDARIVGYSRLKKVYPNEDPESLPSPGVRIMLELMRG